MINNRCQVSKVKLIVLRSYRHSSSYSPEFLALGFAIGPRAVSVHKWITCYLLQFLIWFDGVRFLFCFFFLLLLSTIPFLLLAPSFFKLLFWEMENICKRKMVSKNRLIWFWWVDCIEVRMKRTWINVFSLCGTFQTKTDEIYWRLLNTRRIYWRDAEMNNWENSAQKVSVH